MQTKYYQIWKCKYTGSCILNVENRKGCQYCRYKLCLGAGMNQKWVLTDQERNARFNKHYKKNLNKVNPKVELSMTFTIEEQQAIEDIKTKFQPYHGCPATWRNILLTLSKDAAVNLVESVHGIKPINITTWDYMHYAWVLQLNQQVLPQFAGALSVADFSRLLSRCPADQGMAASLMIFCQPLARGGMCKCSNSKQVRW